MKLVHDMRRCASVRRALWLAGAQCRPRFRPIPDVRANLYTAVEALERSLEYGNQLLTVADAAAIVTAQITELNRLLTLLEHAAGADQ